MATLHVRNVPETLYKRILKVAVEENRSITAEVIQLLSQGLRAREVRQRAAAVIARIGRQTQKKELPVGWPDSITLIQESRCR